MLAFYRGSSQLLQGDRLHIEMRTELTNTSSSNSSFKGAAVLVEGGSLGATVLAGGELLASKAFEEAGLENGDGALEGCAANGVFEVYEADGLFLGAMGVSMFLHVCSG